MPIIIRRDRVSIDHGRQRSSGLIPAIAPKAIAKSGKEERSGFSGDPRKCHWRATHYIWLPEDQREAAREPFLDVPKGDHYPYFLALEQDYEQMAVQQRGLENRAMQFMSVTRQEPKLIHFHSVLDAWMEGKSG